MVNITASTLKTLLDDSTITEATAEQIIDLAIDCLNLFGVEDTISNMTGTAGSKTLSLESREKGAVMIVARAIYYGFYKKPTSTSSGGVTVSTPDLMSNQNVISTIKLAARKLTEIEVSYG